MKNRWAWLFGFSTLIATGWNEADLKTNHECGSMCRNETPRPANLHELIVNRSPPSRVVPLISNGKCNDPAVVSRMTAYPGTTCREPGLCFQTTGVDCYDQDETQVDWQRQRKQVLQLGDLIEAPMRYPADGFESDGSIRPMYFEGLSWKGKPTRVFAWLGIPEMEAGQDKKFPAVVLVHGGGGTAFKEWVGKWNQRGFVAISIAVEGQTDKRDPEGNSWERHSWAGPARVGIYQDSDQPLTEQWMYHAVADTVLAHSLLRHHPQVDPDRIGLMGISWGGVIASTVMGIDKRFAFAIPTYGCGGLADAANQYGRALGENSVYREVWDPIQRMENVTMPVLWFSWTGDLHFPLDAQRDCYRNSAGPYQVALLPQMQHGHAVAWNPPDSYVFAESVVQTGQPWCMQTRLVKSGIEATFEFSSLRPIEKVFLVTTSDTGFTGNRVWNERALPFEQKSRRVAGRAILPEKTTGWFIRLHSGKVVASSDFQDLK